jgi:hypothetical protein
VILLFFGDVSKVGVRMIERKQGGIRLESVAKEKRKRFSQLKALT